MQVIHKYYIQIVVIAKKTNKKGEIMKMYRLTEFSDVKYSEEELHDISCKYCNTTLHESMVNYDDGDPQHYFHEDQWITIIKNYSELKNKYIGDNDGQ